MTDPDHNEDWIEECRSRPALYIPPGAFGLSSIVYELVGNSIDEFLRGHATEISVHFEDDAVEVYDDGAGMPFDVSSETAGNLATEFLTTPHFTRSVDNHAPHVHLEQRGIGLALLNALSAEVEVTSVRSGQGWHQIFRKGQATDAATNMDPAFDRGTKIRITVDREIFEPRFRFDERLVRARLFEAAHLFPGLLFRTAKEHFCSANGLGDLAATHSSYQPWGSSIAAFNTEVDDIQVHFAAIKPWGDTGSSCEIASWANGSRTTEHGHHVAGVRDVIAERDWWPAAFMIHVIMLTPEFAGPTRGRLNVPHVREVVANAIRSEIPLS